MLPVVSVVIPVFNMEEYLPETLDSVLASDYPALEIIVMDDGSRDRSFAIAQEYSRKYPNVSAYTQENRGVCVARNQAISKSRGKYILPVDADNRISPSFISSAVRAIETDAEVKVVTCRMEFFGERSGEWKLPPFSLKILARKNIMDTCALYRRSDWERAGGYCETIIAREDWDFWISLLKYGGKVVRLPETGVYYRVRPHSKRISDRTLKRHVIDTLNARHPDFFERELGGPLRYFRSWSRLINFFAKIYKPRTFCISENFTELGKFTHSLPGTFATQGKTIYKGRNELKEYSVGGRTLIVKSFRKPHIINRIVYTWFRKPKAERSYEYARLLLERGIATPVPVGFITAGSMFLMGRSFYVSLKSECPYTFRDMQSKTFARQDDILKSIARTTARLHGMGWLHRDYSAGNILFRDDTPEVRIELVDLNRMSFCRVDMDKGCKNFERLPCSDNMLRVMASAYAEERNFDKEKCFSLMRKYINEEELRRKR